VTEVDSLHMVLLEFGDVAAYLQAEDDLGRKLTLHEVIAHEFSTVRAPLPEVVAWLVENVRVRPGFTELVERFRPLVVSSGFHELIEPILAREGADVELLANRLDPRPDGCSSSGATSRSARCVGKRASVRRCRRARASWSTSATATRIAAQR
jgi:2-hydroxy-3-keto-5-methylthiopentenyl-1-phosphate phosphatase